MNLSSDKKISLLKRYSFGLTGGLIGWFAAHRILEGNFPLNPVYITLFVLVFTVLWAGVNLLSNFLNNDEN